MAPQDALRELLDEHGLWQYSPQVDGWDWDDETAKEVAKEVVEQELDPGSPVPQGMLTRSSSEAALKKARQRPRGVRGEAHGGGIAAAYRKKERGDVARGHGGRARVALQPLPGDREAAHKPRMQLGFNAAASISVRHLADVYGATP